ncbi:helix-turn-helix domain-containing protein [Nonomuraea fuscirosea]|uniref:helix-turn-helix domain-containing protein n=1 Tax=Nonomuraea fuscirosea TaxID=1291556 RepID=UPI0037185FBE
MSVEVISWALNYAPVDESSAAFVLVGLANHAGPDGRGAFPAVARLMSYTSLSERTIREQLDILEDAGIIRPCDPAIVAAYIKNAGSRPQGWDLDMSLSRENPAHLARFHAAMAKVKAERQERRKRAAAKKATAAGSAAEAEVRPSHPTSDDDAGVRRSHLLGCDGRTPTGATVAPETSFEPSLEPSFREMPPPSASPAGDAQQEGLFGDDTQPPAATAKKPRAASKAKVQRTPQEQARFETADALAQRWWVICEEQKIPNIRKGNKSAFPGFRKMIENALAANCTADEVKQALADLRNPFPSLDALTRAIAERRGVGPRRTNGHHQEQGNHLPVHNLDDAAHEQNRRAFG